MTGASVAHESRSPSALQNDEQAAWTAATGLPIRLPTPRRACPPTTVARRPPARPDVPARHSAAVRAEPIAKLFNGGRRPQPVAMRPYAPPQSIRTPPPFILRPIQADHSELAYAITREAMREYVEQTWGPWIEADQRERHAQAFRPGTQDFIVVRDEVLGLRHIEWRQTHLYLARLYLRPAAQGRGLGSAVLRDLQQQARAVGRSIELQVLKVNSGAQRFYARHGFEQVGERERHWLLRGG